ncbi:GFA family protein [Microvirga zambiensis]|uniref:GFA family protein n=1 Tax=Microvirga zambiensis TaxID=1402137 RepID=UPI00191FE378|nr:GFA family protein [Microvirga zambiensis]
MSEMRIRTGGCACGQLRFEASGEPKRVGLCHCMTCRKISGAPFSAYVIFAADQVTITGETKSWSASPTTEDCFCPVCGSQVFARDAGGETEIRLGAFDEPNLFTPTYELWAKRREHWLGTPGLESFLENREENAS